jgi:prepilin-type processing-associated H-X9-DG protein
MPDWGKVARGAGCGCAILATAVILLPVLCQSREVAKRPTCQSNLKQLGTGLHMYLTDHDQRFPPAHSWQDNIFPYVKNSEVFLCPNRADVVPGFAFNLALHTRRFATIAQPILLPALYDSDRGQRNASDRLTSFTTHETKRDVCSLQVFRDSSAAWGNIAFADGHVKAVRQAPAQEAGLATGSGSAKDRPGARSETEPRP